MHTHQPTLSPVHAALCTKISPHPMCLSVWGWSLSPVASGNQDQAMFVLDCSLNHVCPCVCVFLNVYACCVYDSSYAFDSHTAVSVCANVVCLWLGERTKRKKTQKRGMKSKGEGWCAACLCLVVLKSCFASLVPFGSRWPLPPMSLPSQDRPPNIQYLMKLMKCLGQFNQKWRYNWLKIRWIQIQTLGTILALIFLIIISLIKKNKAQK